MRRATFIASATVLKVARLQKRTNDGVQSEGSTGLIRIVPTFVFRKGRPERGISVANGLNAKAPSPNNLKNPRRVALPIAAGGGNNSRILRQAIYHSLFLSI